MNRLLLRRPTVILLIVVLAGLMLVPLGVLLLSEVWWYDAVGFSSFFWTRFNWQVLIWGATAFIYMGLWWVNYRFALFASRNRPFRFLADTAYRQYTDRIVNYGVASLIGVLSFGIAYRSARMWMAWLQFLRRSPFSEADPVFGQDIGFYVFSLPIYLALHRALLLFLVWALVISLLVYVFKGMLAPQYGWAQPLSDTAQWHLAGLGSAIALTGGFGFWLDRYQLLYSGAGVVFGAGYTDLHARLQADLALVLGALGLALLIIAVAAINRLRLLGIGLGLYLLIFLGMRGVYPAVQQSVTVRPYELETETPYIENNIALTQAAYQLDDVQRQKFAATPGLSQAVLQQHQPTLRNIRLWDAKPLGDTYRQLQEIRLYYSFKDVDYDRYPINGTTEQVMLSARELDINQLDAKAQTWVNQRLKYTHGYGLAMSPVNQATPEGLPELYIKNIPPETTVDIPVDQPAIYYGEATDTYIFTGTSTQEFDYPSGSENVLTQYAGQGGVPMPTLWHRMVFALRYRSLELLISQYFTETSRIHYHRQIQERVKRIAPFLHYDSDPYLSVIDGKLKWILDAYTVSHRYPYAEPLNRSPGADELRKNPDIRQLLNEDVNYIRNSVKAVVDAYDGTVALYAFDEQDPVLRTYRKIFPDLIRPSTEIPASLQAHFRYPVDLFTIQVQMYRTYHMNNPEVFYKREDLWAFPKQTVKQQDQGAKADSVQETMQPYYVTMQLPGTDRQEFILIMPFTPTKKDNMIAWIAARSQGPRENALLLYEFPKKKQIYGPSQVGARIDQETTISKQFSLWNQAGSNVIRGGLLVIPIEESLLYVEPVYLKARQRALPELKQAIVAYDNSVVMENTLEEALAKIFGEQPEAEAPVKNVRSSPPSPKSAEQSEAEQDLARQALDNYEEAQKALQESDWTEYGRLQRELGEQLKQLVEETDE